MWCSQVFAGRNRLVLTCTDTRPFLLLVQIVKVSAA